MHKLVLSFTVCLSLAVFPVNNLGEYLDCILRAIQGSCLDSVPAPPHDNFPKEKKISIKLY